MKEIICGKEVEITRKNNKNIIIRVCANGDIRMTVPNRASMKNAREFFAAKTGWIEKRLKKAVSAPELTLVSGERVYVFGEEKNIILTEKVKAPIIIGKDLIISAKGDRGKAFGKFLTAELKAEAEKSFKFWEVRTGLKPTSVTIRKSETRWGSCNHKTGRINLSLYLAGLPKACLSYVVLHELGHLLYNNHGKEFKRFLDKNLINWRETQKLMRENGERYKIKIKNEKRR